MVVGDSVGNNVGAGLERWAEGRDDVVVWNRSTIGCGFELDAPVVGAPQSNPDCHEWIDRFPTFMDQFQPDVVLVLVGRGDQAQRLVPGSDDPKRVGDPEFDDLMGTAYDGVLSRLERPGVTVAIATFPCLDEIWIYGGKPGPDGREGNDTNAAFNHFLRGLGRPIVDLDRRVCPRGEFTQLVEGIEIGRPDGLHLSDEAAEALSPWLVDQLRVLATER
jgi:hypothetical protein